MKSVSSPNKSINPTGKAPAGYLYVGRAEKKVALISFGYQNIFATRLSFDSGKEG